MVLKVDVLAAAIDHARQMAATNLRSSRAKSRDGGEALDQGVSTSLDTNGEETDSVEPHIPVLAMTPRGKPLTQERVRELAAGPGAIILCGRFEGFDERIFEGREVEQISLADIVLSGGEPAALAILDACIRLLPGVMGAPSSGAEESFEEGLLEYPHYTRPVEWEGRTIPEVLRSGDHAKIAAWRKAMSEHDTRLRRPDLWERHRDARDRPASGARRDD